MPWKPYRTDMGNDIVLTFAAAMAAALVFGYAAHRVGLSPVVGFLLAGVAVGPNTPGFTANVQVAEQFAEMGIILLMFGVGLKFHLHELIAVWRVSVPSALLTSLLTTLLAWAGLTAIGVASNEALVAGLAISVASTVVLMRVLNENRDLSTRAGHIAVGWVVVEDLLTVLLLVTLPVLAEHGTADLGRLGLPLFIAAGKVALCAAVTILVGGRVIPWMLAKVNATKSRELFTLATLALAPGMALLAAKFFGVSMALGAFLAGLVVGRSEFSARAAAEALPLRDAFAVLFFVSIGLLFDPAELLANPLPALVLLGVVLIGKPLAAAVMVRIGGETRPMATQIGGALGQIGEFTFVLGASAKALGLINQPVWNGLVAVAMVSIALNPSLYRRLRQSVRRAASRPDLSQAPVAGHAIVVGYGDVGRRVCEELRSKGIPVTVIDSDIVLIHELQKKGVRALCGDGGSAEVLNEAGIAEAGSLLVCCAIAEPGVLLHGLAKRHPGLRIAVRLIEGLTSELVSGTDFTVISEDSAAAGDITDVATGKA
jgi:CPA2 family monovalent cation:H+ antiporter-2